MNQAEDAEVYEVERIIGRRISLAKKIEYFVFWKGYTMDDCTWESSRDTDCEDVVADFERRCVELRKMRQRYPDAFPLIDRYENDGFATIIDEAVAHIPPERSSFQDIDDFTFASNPNEPLREAENASRGIGGNRLSATHGWNRRVDRSSVDCCRIQNIRGSIRDAAGRVFYLTQWSDKALTWESPRAYTYDMLVLERHETARFLKGRKELVQQFRDMKTTADDSLMSPRKPRYLMEKKPGGAPAATIASLVLPTGSLSVGAGESITLSDLKSSNLLANQAAVPATPVRAPRQSAARPLIIDSSDEESEPDVSMKSVKEPYVYINHVAGSKNRAYWQSRAMARPGRPKYFESEDEGEVVEEFIVQGGRVGVTSSGAVAPPPRWNTPSTSSTPSESAGYAVDIQPSSVPAKLDTCAACDAHIPSRESGTAGKCTRCKLLYHPQCYDELLKRMGLEGDPSDSSSWLKDKFTCAFCNRYAGREVGVYLTWRVNKAGDQDVLPCAVGSVDVLVKWSKFSYRHLDWVPFTWLKSTRRASSGHLRNISRGALAGQDPWNLEDRYNKSFTEPACIIDVRPASASLVEERTRQLELAEPMVEESAWDLYTEYEQVCMTWKGLDMSGFSWETPPNPADDADDYMAWYDVFQRWKRASAVSLLKHNRAEKQRKMDAQADVAAEQRLDVSGQPSFLRGGQLMDHQVVGANWLLERWRKRKPAILADEMGMGKTIQVIAFMLAIYHSTIQTGLSGAKATSSNSGTFPFLVVVPTTLVSNWMLEFQKWAPELVVAQLSGRSADREIQLSHTIFRTSETGKKDLCCHVLLASYDAATNSAGISALMSRSFVWEAIIVDEGQRLKNEQTKTYAALSRFHARQRVVLTGTPLQNDIGELFSIMSFMDPEIFGTPSDLKGRLSAETAEGISNIRDIVRPYILRRTKDDQLALVPPKCELILPVSMTRLQRELYRATLSRNADLLRSIATALHSNSAAARDIDALANANGTAANSEADSLGRGKRGQDVPRHVKPARVSSLTNILMEVRRIVSHPYLLRNVEPEFGTEEEKHRRLIDSSGKLQLLHALIPEFKARGHRVLLFSQFKDTLTIIEDYLTAEEIGYERIDGDTPPVERQTKVNAFNAPDSTSLVFMATTRTGGLGLNLTSADVVIIFDCDFNPHADLQAMARAHRIGQKKPVTVLKFVVQDSAEERIVKAATRKLVLDHLVIQSIDDDSAISDKLLQPTDVELALRHGASKLFEPDADEHAESRAIRYDHARVVSLLDKCESELRTEVARIEQETAREISLPKEFANSTVSKFLRVWTLDATGVQMEELLDGSSDTPESNVDIWSQLLDTAASDAQLEEAISSEEIGGRHLRLRKRKVDYVIDEKNEGDSARKLRKPLHPLGEDGDYMQDNALESDGDDASEISDMSVLGTKAALDPIAIVSRIELSKIIELHCERLVRFYVVNARDLNPMNSQDTSAIADTFKRASQVVPGKSDTQHADPELFFPIPSNMRLRKGVQPPYQGTARTCWACSRLRHSSSFCPRICNPEFIALIQKIKTISEFWRNPIYYRFIHWYAYQYVWFMLTAPNGTDVSERNRAKNREYSVDVNVYLKEIRAAIVKARSASQQVEPPLLDAGVLSPSPYTIELPSGAQNMRGVYERMSGRLDDGTVSKFFNTMSSANPKYADLNKATDSVITLRNNHRSLLALRENTIRGARAKLGSWLERPDSTTLPKVSQLLLGVRCIVGSSVDIRNALVSKVVLRKALGIAHNEADALLRLLLGDNKKLVSPGVYANIVRSRHLLLLLLRIRTSNIRVTSQSAEKFQAMSSRLDLLCQHLVSLMDESESRTSIRSVNSSLDRLSQLVNAEKKRREAQGAVTNPSSSGSRSGEFSSAELAYRSQYKKRFTHEASSIYACLKDVLGGYEKTVLPSRAPVVNSIASTVVAAPLASANNNSNAAVVRNVMPQRSLSQSPAPISSSPSIVGAVPATVGNAPVRQTQSVQHVQSQTPPVLSRRSTVGAAPSSASIAGAQDSPPPTQRVESQVVQPVKKLSLQPVLFQRKETLDAPLSTPPAAGETSSSLPAAAQPAEQSYQQLSMLALNSLIQQKQQHVPSLPTASTPVAMSVATPSTAPVATSQQQRRLSNGMVLSARSIAPSPQVGSEYGSARGDSLSAIDTADVANVVATQLGLSQMSPTDTQQPTFGLGTSSVSSRPESTLANIVHASEMLQWRDRTLSPHATATQQQQLPQLNRQHHRVVHPQQQQQHYLQQHQHQQHQQQTYNQYQGQQVSPVSSSVYAQWNAMDQQQRQYQLQQQQISQIQAQQAAHQVAQAQRWQHVDQQQLQQLQLQVQQYMQQNPHYASAALAGSTAMVPTTMSQMRMMMTPLTPAAHISLVTPMSNNTGIGSPEAGNGGGGGGGGDKWDLACALCGELLHTPSSCTNRTDISKLTRRRVEVESNANLGMTIKEMTLDTIDKYLKAAYKI
ncbi:hypothetical protein LPJ59_000395 [Coemansia sp. RSA 2399]|nr:hypothetical protein LPJ59_000395 [Coemansia sp. RSA 2399]KAJ1908044.1 hypothetical protein LPJ81_000358 [Coemansia sp. IMI 209127]